MELLHKAAELGSNHIELFIVIYCLYVARVLREIREEATNIRIVMFDRKQRGE